MLTRPVAGRLGAVLVQFWQLRRDLDPDLSACNSERPTRAPVMAPGQRPGAGAVLMTGTDYVGGPAFAF